MVEGSVLISEAIQLLMSGSTRREVSERLAVKHGLDSGKAKAWVRRALTRISDRVEADTPLLAARMIERYEDLYDQATEAGELAVARQVLHDISTIFGVLKNKSVGKQITNNTLNVSQVTLSDKSQETIDNALKLLKDTVITEPVPRMRTVLNANEE